MIVIDEGMHRQQFDRGDAERLHIFDHLTGAEAGIGAAQRLRYFRMTLGEALDMGLVEDGVVPGHKLAVGLAFPVEIWIDHHAFRHEGRAVPLVEGEVVHRLHLIAEDRGVPFELAGMGAGIGVQHQLVGIEAVPRVRLVGAMDAVAIEGAWPDLGQVPVEDLISVFGQFEARDLLVARAVEEAYLHAGGVGGEEREIGALAIPARPERERRAFPDLEIAVPLRRAPYFMFQIFEPIQCLTPCRMIVRVAEAANASRAGYDPL